LLAIVIKLILQFGIVLSLCGQKRLMPKSGPIIIVEDDHDDQEVLREVFEELNIPNLLRFFTSCKDTFDYLLTTMERPFLIISDINLPAMTGFEFKEQINQNECLRKKNIPFIFLSTNSEAAAIAKSYSLFAQGYFVKPTKLIDIKDMISKIVEYWKLSSR
jgi:CheY-like chemotaxis protein